MILLVSLSFVVSCCDLRTRCRPRVTEDLFTVLRRSHVHNPCHSVRASSMCPSDDSTGTVKDTLTDGVDAEGPYRSSGRTTNVCAVLVCRMGGPASTDVVPVRGLGTNPLVSLWDSESLTLVFQ